MVNSYLILLLLIYGVFSMDSEFTAYFSTQMGDSILGFHLRFQAQKLLSLSVSDEGSEKSQSVISNTNSHNKMEETVFRQLKCYFSSAISLQTIPLAPQGTLFQKSVWHELCKIPLGETRTYGEIAHKLNSSARAVGNACRKNPIQIIVPCHRVVSAKGLGGYAGETQGRQLDIKRWLLNHEGVLL